MSNLSLHLVESADMYPGEPALRCDGATTTYSELADIAARFAAYLADQGVGAGDRVGVMLASRPEFAMVFYGVLHAGAVVVPIDPLGSACEVEYLLTNTGACLLVFTPSCEAAATAGALAAGVRVIAVHEDTLERLTASFLGHAWPVTRAGDDDAVILRTSGPTRSPMDARLTHRNLASRQAFIARKLLNIGPDDVVMVGLPLFGAAGMTCALATTISTGATLALLPRFDACRALEMVAAERVTVVAGQPPMYTAMLEAIAGRNPELGTLRVCVSAGAAMPVDVLRRLEHRFDCTVVEI